MRSIAIKSAAALSALALAVTAGCSGSSSSHHAGGSVATKAGVQAKTVKQAAGADAALVQHALPKRITNQPAVRKSVVQTSCSAIASGWSASGTAKNSTATTRTYRIVVYFTTVHATTLDFARTSVRVAPGHTAKWTASKKFAAQKQMLCPMPGISAS